MYQFIKDLYHLDVKMVPRMVPKLTKNAIMLNTFTKMNVKLATRTLSTSTAKGMKAYVNLGMISEEAEATADLIEMMDKFFDAFNSRFRSDKIKVSFQNFRQIITQRSLYLQKILYVPCR